MVNHLLLLIISLSAALALTPLVRVVALYLGAVDSPGARKIHSKAVPRLGGVSVVLSSALAVYAMVTLERFDGLVVSRDPSVWFPVLMGGVLVFVVGIWDDIQSLSVRVKFLFQAVAAGVAIWAGVRIEPAFFVVGTLDVGFLAVPLTFLWIVGITNAFNLIDGLDGLAVGLASIAAATSGTIFLIRGDAQGSMLMAILLGALLGFLRYNFNPAKIFLGDSGSLVVGYTLAVTAIMGSQKEATALAVVVPLLVFGLPILDTMLSMIRRFMAGSQGMQPYATSMAQRVLGAKQMFEADQAHIHHRLLAIGFSHRSAVLMMYAVALGLSAMALLSVLAQFRNAGIILMTVGLSTYIGIRKLGYQEVTFLKVGTLLRWCDQITFKRFFFIGFVDVVLIAAAYWISYLLKYEFHGRPEVRTWYLGTFPLVLFVQLGACSVCGLYRGVCRTTGIGDLLRILFAVGTAVMFSYVVALLNVPPSGALSFFCINLLVLGGLTGGTRCIYRVLDYIYQREQVSSSGVLIYGAGRGGQLVIRANLGLRLIGFIDDNLELQGRTVDGVPVLGSGSDLALLLKREPTASLIISSDKIRDDRLEAALSICNMRQIPIMYIRLRIEPIEKNKNNKNNKEDRTYPVPANQEAENPK